jgi:hypothetical protein
MNAGRQGSRSRSLRIHRGRMVPLLGRGSSVLRFQERTVAPPWCDTECPARPPSCWWSVPARQPHAASEQSVSRTWLACGRSSRCNTPGAPPSARPSRRPASHSSPLRAAPAARPRQSGPESEAHLGHAYCGGANSQILSKAAPLSSRLDISRFLSAQDTANDSHSCRHMERARIAKLGWEDGCRSGLRNQIAVMPFGSDRSG